MHSVYILSQSGRATPQTYVGYTPQPPEARVAEHNAGQCDATNAGRPWELCAVISGFRTKNAALAFEKQLQAQPARGSDAKVRQARALAAGPRWERSRLTVEEAVAPPTDTMPPSELDIDQVRPARRLRKNSFRSGILKGPLCMLSEQFLEAALRFNLAEKNTASFHIYPEHRLGETRFLVVFAPPQRALHRPCLHLYRFLRDFLRDQYPVTMALEFRLDLTGVEAMAGHLDRWFDGHQAAGLEGASVLRRNNVRGRQGVKALLSRFVEDRNTVLVRYGEADKRYRNVSELRITIGRVGAGPSDNPNRGLQEHRANNRVRKVESPDGDCFWMCLLLSLDKSDVRRNGGKIWLPTELATADALRELCGLEHLKGEAVPLGAQMQAAQRLEWRQTPNGPLRGVRIYVYDFNLHLQRVFPPPYEEDITEEHVDRQDVHLIQSHNHFDLWRNTNETKPNVARALSLYTACIESRVNQRFADYIESTTDPMCELSMQEQKLIWFCRYQHLQPNEEAIQDALMEDLGCGPVLETVELVPHCGNYIWVPTECPLLWPNGAKRPLLTPGSGEKGEMDKSCSILATGLLHRCKHVEPKISRTQANDLQVLEDRADDLAAVEPYFPPPFEVFCMDYCLTFDIETASTEDGTFYTYAVGWTVGTDGVGHRSVARTIEDLKGRLMKDTLEEWADKADEINVQWRAEQYAEAVELGVNDLREKVKQLMQGSAGGKATKGLKKAQLLELYSEAVFHEGNAEDLVEQAGALKKTELRALVVERVGKPWENKEHGELLALYEKALEDAGPGLFCYSYNGSRFDMVDVVHTLTSMMDTAPQDYLKSNGRVISFTWRSLHFRDLCLITMCPLANACKSYGVKTSKGYLPHGYLQRLPSLQAILDRLHGATSWGGLEPHIDWLSGAKPDEVQKRIVGQSYDDWLRRKDKHGGFVFPLMEDWDAKTGPFTESGAFKLIPKMIAYLEDDVRGTHEVLEQVGMCYNRDYGCDIRVNLTVGSLATRIWKGVLPTHVAKIVNEQLYKRVHSAVRGGFCGPLGYFDYTAGDGEFVYKVDVTSLYPASTGCEFFKAGPGASYWRGFPAPGLLDNTWQERDFGGVQVIRGDAVYTRLLEWHGFAQIRFDQSAMAYPTLQINLKEGSHQTLAPVLHGEGRFSLPLIQHAIDNGCCVWLSHCDYVEYLRGAEGNKQEFNPFPTYMDPLVAKKNNADAVLSLLKARGDKKTVKMYARDAVIGIEELTGQKLVYSDAKRSVTNELANRAFRGEALCPTRSNSGLKTSADVVRTVSKLLLNSLLGRLDMAVDRTQTVLTQSKADKDAVIQGVFKYREARSDNIRCGDEDWFRLTFREGGFFEHIKGAETAPHLWATMLDYSKILMGEAFLWLARNDCKLLYTDTDSIAFAGTPEKYAAFDEIFGSAKKLLGAFEAEHCGDGYHRLVTVGPKKYVVVHRNEDGTEHMEWKGNGIQAKENAETAEGTMLDTFEAVLAGKTCEVDYFKIGPDAASQLKHTVDSKKKLRFLCLKGRCTEGEDGSPLRVDWWQSAEEFAEYAKTIQTPLGASD